MLEEVGVDAASDPTLNRRLPRYAAADAAAAGRGVRGARGAGPNSLGALRRQHAVFRDRRQRRVPRAGFSKERRLEPQITIGLLTDAAGFPLMVEAFGDNKAETATMLPVITVFMAAYRLREVTVVADTVVYTSRSRSGCSSTTCAPGRSTTTSGS